MAARLVQPDPSHAPMSEILTQPLNELHALTQTLFHSLSPTQAKPPPAPSISAFVEADANLAAAVKLARRHQIKQREIERLKDEFLALEERWRETVMDLESGKRELEVVLTESEERIKNIEAAKKGVSANVLSALDQLSHRFQLQYRTQSFWRMLKASPLSHLPHQICQILYQGNLRHHCFSLRSPTRRKCAVAV